MHQQNDHLWMARALRLARKGLYSTHPNPRVGCVIVRDGKCIGEGYHQVAGGPHAEINALQQVEGGVNGATVYVTLEPCAHSGKTSPCSQALINARPARVVVAMVDPNPLVAGKGIAQIREAGIEVEQGLMQDQAEQLNPGFIKRMREKKPFLRVKMASSLDGKTALANGVSQWITGAEARRDVQLYRAQSSAVLSSAETVLADDAALNVRLDAAELGQEIPVRQPVRIVLDPEQRLSGLENLFSLDGPVWVVSPEESVAKFEASSQVRFIGLPLAQGRFDLEQLMRELARLEINEVHTECGPTLAGALLRAGMVDELVLYQAARLFGSAARGLFDLGELTIISDGINLKLQDVRLIGDDIRMIATLER